MRRIGVLVCLVMFLGLFGCGGKPSAEKKAASGKSGKDIFKGATLGTNGKSCESCHPNGDMLSGVGKKHEKPQELENRVNQCIAGGLKGKKLDTASSDMKALAEYLRTL